jgi:hypothetical protein
VSEGGRGGKGGRERPYYLPWARMAPAEAAGEEQVSA